MTKAELALIEQALDTGDPQLLSEALVIVRNYRVRPNAPSNLNDAAHPLLRHFPRGTGNFGYDCRCLVCGMMWREDPVNQLLPGAFPSCRQCTARDVQRTRLTSSDFFKPIP